MADTKSLVLLGSTGSIGVQALEVAQGAGYRVAALAAGSRVEPFEEQIRRYRPAAAAMFDEKAAADLKVRVRDLPVRITAGMEGLCELAALPEADMVLNAVVGMVGLLPTLAAVRAGHDVALANKETLVAGGALVMDAVARRGVKLLPVDSEHSAIFQCLQGRPPRERALKRLILTASGGPFFGKSAAELERVTVQDALRHPNWSMGAKITIDSATMMNKGLELIEARWLFDVDPKDIDIVVHRESVVHSLIEYTDHSVIAQLGVPDMRIPIQYALTWPERLPSPVPRLDLAAYQKLTFFAPDYETFPCMTYCREAITRGGLYPAAVNAANEEAVALFLTGRIGFTAIPRLVASALDLTLPAGDTAEAVLEADRHVREIVRAAV
ncbi:1-deoxy-D-xylulose-5-phosphate reductoisomerase [Anaeromassilibacillus sp. SJQ-5]